MEIRPDDGNKNGLFLVYVAWSVLAFTNCSDQGLRAIHSRGLLKEVVDCD